MADNHPLVVAHDDAVREKILRLAAAADCRTDLVGDLEAVGRLWTTAPLVLVDEAAADRRRGELPRRAGVLLVCEGPPTAGGWRLAFELGADDVVVLEQNEAGLVAALADAAEQPGARRGQVLAVLGGRGGAGASVLAATVAVCESRQRGDALLVDCDPLGGGMDLLLGAETEAGLRWPGLRVSSGRVSMAELDAALPGLRSGEGRFSVLSCDRDGPAPEPGAVAAVVEAGRRAGRVVVCDLPRHLGQAGKEAVRHADLAVLVVPAEVRACVAATRVLAQLNESTVPVRVLARGPAPEGLTAADVADAVGAPLLCWMRPERGLARSLERGVFNPASRGALGTAAHTVLRALGEVAGGAAGAAGGASGSNNGQQLKPPSTSITAPVT